MNRIGAIAWNTFREAVRDRILYSILAFALLLIGAAVILAGLSLGQESRIVKDLGLASTTLFGTFIAIFLGITLVSKEIERRTIVQALEKFGGNRSAAAEALGISRRTLQRKLKDYKLASDQTDQDGDV